MLLSFVACDRCVDAIFDCTLSLIAVFEQHIRPLGVGWSDDRGPAPKPWGFRVFGVFA